VLYLEKISYELKALPQWALTEKETKEPYPVAGNRKKRASCNDQADWSTFENAVNALQHSDRFVGIAFAITRNDCYAIIDLDKAFVNGELTPQARDIINRFNSYTEKSLSGTGIHIVIITSNNDIYIDDPPIEIYSRSHFMTLTGDIFENRDTIQERQSELESVIQDYHLIKEPEPKPANTQHINEHTNKDIEFIRDRELQKFVSRAYVGNRHNTGMDLACQLRDNRIPSQLAEDTMRQYQSMLPQDGHNYPWDEAKDTLESVYSTPARQPSYRQSGNHINRTKKNKAGDIRVMGEPEQEPIKPIEFFKCTDYGNCERLVYWHGNNIRYCHDLKAWFIWDGIRWKEDNFGEIRRRAKDVVRRIYKEASECTDDDMRKSYLKHIKESESNFKQKALIELAQSEIEVSILQNQLDSNDYFFNVLNGTIDLETGELLPHQRENLITRLSPVNYDPDAKLELWDNFLNTVTSGKEGIKEGIKAFLQQAVGYSLTGDTAEEVLFFVHGEAATGKSTFIEAVKAVMGDYAKTADFESFLKRKEVGTIRNDIANLAGARLVTSIEVDEGKALAEGLIKMITGGDTVRARFLYHEGFDFLPKMKLWLCANHVPKVKHDDEAMWRRILKIPFNHVIPKEDRDSQVKKTLKDPSIAGPAILAWAVKGCGLYLEKGKLCVPEGITKATEDYRASMDIMKPFIDECCILGIEKTARVTDLHNKYIEWSGYHISRKEFGNKLEALNFKKDKKESGWFWIGIGISD
jgi:putative DNA primase/helicase